MKRTQPSASPSRHRRWLLGIVSAAAVIGGGWWFAGYLRAGHQVARVQELQQQLRDSEKLPTEQRRALWEQMRQEMDQLPDAYREQMWQEQRAKFEQRRDDEIRTLLALPADQRAAAIDKQIDEMETRRKQWEQRRQQRPPAGGPSTSASTGNAAAGQARGDRGRGPGGRRGSDLTGKAGLERRKRRLDQSTAQQRAERAEYRRLVEARRQQRGMPANPWPR